MAELEQLGAGEWAMAVEWLDPELVEPDEGNPNEQDDETFDALVLQIQQNGWTAPAQVVPVDGGKYRLVAGEHRWMAARVLQTRLPAVLLDPATWDADRRQMQLVADNLISGKLNPDKFTKLYSDLARRYDGEVLKKYMGFSKGDQFEKLFRETKAGLPPELADALDASKAEIRTIDDLSRVLNRLFQEHGETLPSNMMVFSFGGKEVLWIRANKALWSLATEISEHAVEAGQDVAEAFVAALSTAKAAAP